MKHNVTINDVYKNFNKYSHYDEKPIVEITIDYEFDWWEIVVNKLFPNFFKLKEPIEMYYTCESTSPNKYSDWFDDQGFTAKSELCKRFSNAHDVAKSKGEIKNWKDREKMIKDIIE